MNTTTMVTGGAGFVGRQIVRNLAKRSVHTRLVLRAGQSNALPQPCGLDSVVESDDLFGESADWWAETCRGIDTVIHAAWYAEPGKYLLSLKNLECLKGTLAIAQGAIKAGVRRFIGIGTCFEYATSDAPLEATSPLNPTTPYAASKAAAFLALSQCLPVGGVSFAWCRLFYMYGEGEDPRRLTAAIRNALIRNEPIALTSGHQVRDFLDVTEVGTRVVSVAQSTLTGPVNICSGVPITVRSLAEAIADEFGRRDLLQFGARPDNLIDPPFVVGVPNDILPDS